jgi:SAM-dependent methyltransferase
VLSLSSVRPRRADELENGLIVINDIGSFIHQRVSERPPALRCEEPHLPWQYRRAVEWWPDIVPSVAGALQLRRFAERVGGPTLEVGFGSGQRLLACRAAGLDIDGIETSRGLYAACRERFEADGHPGHRLYLQPLHEIDLPRRYRSIYAGGVLGAGASAEADAVGLYRLYRALEPGGCLLIDHPTAWGRAPRRAAWWIGARRQWPPAFDACELAIPSGRRILRLSSQLFDHAQETASLSYTVRARCFEDGELRLSRGLAQRQRFYTPREVVGLLHRAGFDQRRITSLPVPAAERSLWLAEKSLPAPASPSHFLGPIGLAGAIAMRSGGASW